jgi:hypothetical protein
MVRNYATQFGGVAHIESEVGRGTTVRLLFPRCSESLDETSAKTMPLSTLPSGNETVLLLATAEGLRATISQILEVLGYSVVTSNDAAQAEKVLGARPVDLVIVDGAHAAALAERLAAMPPAPRRRVVQLASSGAVSEGRPKGRVLLKPFSLADLAQTVREALDESKGAAV